MDFEQLSCSIVPCWVSCKIEIEVDGFIVLTGTLGRSTWMSLKDDFRSTIGKLEKAGKEIDRMANVEHLYQSNQAFKGTIVDFLSELIMTDMYYSCNRAQVASRRDQCEQPFK